jgi:ferric-dicitrate binding protein FerR (iron transport regulator)
MKTKHEEQLVAETGRWLRSLREPEAREECREQFEEWFSEDEMDDEQVRVTFRLWRNVLGGARR